MRDFIRSTAAYAARYQVNDDSLHEQRGGRGGLDLRDTELRRARICITKCPYRQQAQDPAPLTTTSAAACRPDSPSSPCCRTMVHSSPRSDPAQLSHKARQNQPCEPSLRNHRKDVPTLGRPFHVDNTLTPDFT